MSTNCSLRFGAVPVAWSKLGRPDAPVGRETPMYFAWLEGASRLAAVEGFGVEVGAGVVLLVPS